MLLSLVILSIGAQPHMAFGALEYAIFVAVTCLGAASGVARARSLKLAVNPLDGTVLSYTDGVAILLLAVLIAARTYARTLAELSNIQLPVIADATMLFAVGMIVAQRYFTWRRVKALRPVCQLHLAR